MRVTDSHPDLGCQGHECGRSRQGLSLEKTLEPRREWTSLEPESVKQVRAQAEGMYGEKQQGGGLGVDVSFIHSFIHSTCTEFYIPDATPGSGN